MRYWLAIAVVLALIVVPVKAQGTRDKKKAADVFECPEGMIPSSRWTETELVGHTLTRVDPEQLLVYRFTEAGDVIVSVGRVNGEITAPVWRWKIDRNGVLRVTGEDGVNEKYRKVCSGPDRILVAVGRSRMLFADSKPRE